MTPTNIKKLIQNGERLTLEAKLAKTDVPKSLWESYSAFANTMGGTILLGVFEDVKEKQHMKMQNMLRMIGYGENLGSGFPLILNAWKQAGWGEPELKNRLEVDEVALVLPIQRFEGTGPKTGPKVGSKSAPKNRKRKSRKNTQEGRLDMIIALIHNEPQITREVICDALGVSLTTLRKYLRILKEQYGLHYEGSSKTGQWVIDDKKNQ